MQTKKSKIAFKEAKKVIPGGVDSPVRAFGAVGGDPLFIERGEGAYIYDIDGNRYLDFVQSWGPLILGHRNRYIENAVIEAVKKGLSFGAPTEVETKLAKEICDLFPIIDKIRFVSSGTEAVMSAIRLARGFTGKEDIIKFEGCYHGHSDSLLVQAGSGATTFGNPSSPGVPRDFTKHTILAKYNNIQSVRECFKKSHNIACVIIEPIAGNMGLIPAKKAFLEELKEICEENGTLLIFDEVMSGFRASLLGAQGILNIKPDIVTFGKVIGGGMPVGAFGARSEIMDKLAPEGPVYQAGTLSGNPIAMSAGLATIRQLKSQPEIYGELEFLAKKLVEGLKKSAGSCNIPVQVEVRGSMFGFFFNEKEVNNYDDAKESNLKLFAKFHSKMLKRGYYFACSQFEAGFISTAMNEEMIEEVIEASNDIFREIIDEE